MGFENRKHSPEARAKISDAMKKRHQENPALRESIRIAQEARAEDYRTQQELAEAGIEVRRYRHSPETRSKISAALKGRKPSPQCTAALKVYWEEVRRDREALEIGKRDNPLFWTD